MAHHEADTGFSGSCETVLRFQDLALERNLVSTETRNERLTNEEPPIREGTLGKCLIFSFQKFENSDCKERKGAPVDAARLKKIFTDLNYDVAPICEDFRRCAMLKKLKNVSKVDHSGSKHFVCCILTHGAGLGYFHTHDEVVAIDDILKIFSRQSCKSLDGKQKFFIIQACRGYEAECGVAYLDVPDGPILVREKDCFNCVDKPDSPSPVKEDDSNCVDVPDGSSPAPASENNYLDFLVAYATYPGRVAFSFTKENVAHGSFFIDEICRSLENFSQKLDLLQILTVVNYRMANFYESGGSTEAKFEEKKQMPCFSSTLTKNICYEKAISRSDSEHTRAFKKRREQTSLGERSDEYPWEDNKFLKLKPESIQFLSLLHLNEMLSGEVTSSVFWKYAKENCYLSEEIDSGLSRNKLAENLKNEQDFSRTKCLLFMVAAEAKRERLYNLNGKTYLKTDIIEQFAGKSYLVKIPKIFIFVMLPRPKKMKPCVIAESYSYSGILPEHANILDITIKIQDANLLKIILNKFGDILKKYHGESEEKNLLNVLTELNEDLVKNCGFNCSSLSDKMSTFAFHSTLTKTVSLP